MSEAPFEIPMAIFVAIRESARVKESSRPVDASAFIFEADPRFLTSGAR